LERDPNKKLTYYERAKNKIPFKEKTPWGKTKSIISMTLAIVITPIIIVAVIPFVIIGGYVFSIGFLCLSFYTASTYVCKCISNFVDNFV
jgi:hypothetical protein